MCGICGWVGREPGPMADAIGAMLRALAPRGPDACGVWRAPDRVAVLGHRRLSIIDPVGSPQPMATEDESAVVTFNGEIYNFRELRGALQRAGCRFRTRGDTEVLLRLYEARGTGLVERLDGMFAFGLYDARRRTLLLARDRLGIKPLYYWHDPAGGDLLFGSDLGALLAAPSLPRRLDEDALAEYLHFGFVVHPRTWLRGVRQLEPGQWLEWHDGRVTLGRYYAWRYEPDASLADAATAALELERVVGEAVASHLVADVPLGSFLSGGLDSATVTGTAQRIRARGGGRMESFTVRFWLEAFDESVRAAAVAADLGTEHREIDAAALPFDRTAVDALIAGLGEPFGDTSALAVDLLCRYARRHVKVALSGDGGDELFLGYVGFERQRLARRLRAVPRPLRRVALALAPRHGAALPRRLHKYLALSLDDDAGIILEWHRRWAWADLHALLGGELFERLFPEHEPPFPALRELIGAGARGGFAEQQMRFHLRVVLPCDGLFKVDRMSMAHGLEVRVPLLANGMLDYAGRLPLAMRRRDGRSKEPLRTVAERLAPALAHPSPKRGFGFPIAAWMRRDLERCWREWEITASLGRLGVATDAVDALVAAFGRAADDGRQFERNRLAQHLFDLLLLGAWAERHRVAR